MQEMAVFGSNFGANQQIRILYRCWQARPPYDELTYLEALRRRGSPLLDQLGAVAETT